MNIDGDPIWSPIKDNDLKYAVNTNWDLFEHATTKRYYLRQDASWLTATDVKGPWTPAGQLPASFSKLPADENWKEVKAALPGKKLDAKNAPTVFVSLVPAEMILVRGEPSYSLVEGTSNLLWVQNTDADVFRVGRSGPIYYLVAGRWFSAADFKGPWTFATPTLPEDFRKIPVEHPRSRVLASVPGTSQAAEAVLLAQVPQTARVKKSELKAPEVAYQGEPKFEPIEKTTVARAVNTDKDIVKVGDLYYMCFQGVWFMAKAPQGPWEVATSVPEAIYQIPASSPVHNVTYVTVVEDNSNDDWVTFAAVAGYTGLMIGWGCAVWGTGYYYPPYWGMGGYYPYYYPHYPTYGYGAWYNPWTGGYGRTAVAYGPYGGAGVTARYNPRTGTYARGAAAWGPYGARGAGQAYNPRTGTYAQTRQGSNVYGSWGSTAVQRGDDWARTSRVTNNRTGNTTRVTQGSGGGESISRSGGGTVARTGSGDVYAGRDGNVYRKEGDSWQKYDNGSWGNVDRPAGTGDRAAATGDRAAAAGATPRTTDTSTARAGASGGSTVSQLDRDRAARTDGATRAKDAGSYPIRRWQHRRLRRQLPPERRITRRRHAWGRGAQTIDGRIGPRDGRDQGPKGLSHDSAACFKPPGVLGPTDTGPGPIGPSALLPIAPSVHRPCPRIVRARASRATVDTGATGSDVRATRTRTFGPSALAARTGLPRRDRPLAPWSPPSLGPLGSECDEQSGRELGLPERRDVQSDDAAARRADAAVGVAVHEHGIDAAVEPEADVPRRHELHAAARGQRKAHLVVVG